MENLKEVRCLYCKEYLSNITNNISFKSDEKWNSIHIECDCQFCDKKQCINIIAGKGNVYITLTNRPDDSY